MHFPGLGRIDRHAKRLAEILSILGKYGLADLLDGLQLDWLQAKLASFDGDRFAKVSREMRVRLALAELGPTFIKFGQVLSTRGDVIGPELAKELARLRSNTPPDSADIIRATVATELGKPVGELFLEFEERALASGSIGQVHRAKLLDGRPIVVKVQHAGIEQTINSDLEIMAHLAEFVQKHLSSLHAYNPAAIVREFRRTILRELDFARERRNLEEFARNFSNDKTVHFPAVFIERCSSRVLTMELLSGVSFEDGDALRQACLDVNALVHRGVNAYLQMIFRDGFYHADPHPGNLFLLPAGVLGIIDCGMVGRVDDFLRDQMECLLLGIIRKDAQEVADVVVRLGAPPANLDMMALRVDLNDFVLEIGSRPLPEINLGEALQGIIDIIRRYRITLPPSCALLLKTMIMLEGASRQLRPTVSLAELVQLYEKTSLRRRVSVRAFAGRVARTYRDWDRLLEGLPRDLSEIARRVRGGQFEVRLTHRRLESTVNRLVMGLLTAALFVGSAELWSRDVPPAWHGVSLPGVLGYALALFLGYRLYREIRRTEKDLSEP